MASETRKEQIFNKLYDSNFGSISAEESFKISMLDALQRLKEAQEVENIDRLYDYLIKLSEWYANGHSSMIRGRFAGLFIVVYEVITRRAKKSYTDNSTHYKNPELARKIALEFGKLFILNVERFYQNTPVQTHWKPYFDAVIEPDSHPLLILGKGINAHLNYDLTEALVTSGATRESYSDFIQSGEDFLECIPEIASRLKEVYDIDEDVTKQFFKAFFLGKAIDNVVQGDDVFSRRIFQALRILAFRNARLKMNLQKDSSVVGLIRLKALEHGRSNFVQLADAALDSWVARILLDSKSYSPIEAHQQATRDLGRILGIAFNSLFDTGAQSLLEVIIEMQDRCRMHQNDKSWTFGTTKACEL